MRWFAFGVENASAKALYGAYCLIESIVLEVDKGFLERRLENVAAAMREGKYLQDIFLETREIPT